MVALNIGLGAYLLAIGSPIAGAFAIVTAGLVVLSVYGYVRHGSVWLAFNALRNGNGERAEKLLRQIANPTWLSSGDRAYYEWCKALIACEKGETESAKAHLRRALEHRLRTQNDRSLVNSQMAELLIWGGDLPAARVYLEAARADASTASAANAVWSVETMALAAANPPPNPGAPSPSPPSSPATPPPT